MKNFLLKVALIGAMFAGFALTGCENEDPMENVAMGAEVTSTSLTSVTAKVMSNDITEYAYMVATAGTAKPTADAVFANGTVKTLEFGDGEDAFTVASLTPETDYVLYVAGRIGSNYYPMVFELNFATSIIPASMTAALVEAATTAQTVSVEVKTVKIKAFAYSAVKAEDAGESAPTADVVFADGKMVECTDGTHTFTIEEMSPNTEYVIYVAGLLSEADANGTNQPYEKVLSIQATTGDFTDELTIFDDNGRHFKVHIKPTLSDPANVIKWGTRDIFMHNMNSNPDFESLNLHDEYYGNYFQGDTTLIFDEEHGYVWRENIGDYATYYEAITPGQPQVISFGEFKYEEDEEIHGRWGWGAGYYVPMCDMDAYWDYYYMEWQAPESEDPYWTGYHKQVIYQTKSPDLLTPTVNVTMNLRPNGGVITMTPEEGVDRYTYMFLDYTNYDQVMALLDNNQDYLQWFTTSYVAYMMVGTFTESVPISFDMKDVFWDIDKDATYYMYVVAMKDEVEGSLDAKYQNFQAFEIHLPDYSVPAPELVITPYEATSAYEVKFNVKCPTQDAVEGVYAANYAREWNEAGFDDDLASALEYYGNELDSTTIAKINSAEGMDFIFTTREDATTKLAVMLANFEGRMSTPALAEVRSLRAPAKEPVESEYFTSLEGDWTATATNIQVKRTYNYSNFSYTYDTIYTEKVSKVTIGDISYPETPSEEVYNIWFDNTPYTTKEAVDEQYALFTDAVDVFNEKTENQNRILMNGFDFQVGLSSTTKTYSSYKSAYDLWSSETYNGYDNESPVWDFGPKWYLEIAADGSISVPFDMNSLAPMANWSYYYPHYLAAVSETAYLPYDPETLSTGYFPVEISQSGNTIIVKAFVFEDEAYYPSSGYVLNGNYYAQNGRVGSEIVLTRGWTEEGEGDVTTSLAEAGGKFVSSNYQALYNVKEAQKPMSRTVVKALPEFKQVKHQKALTGEQFKAKVAEFAQKNKAARK